MRGKNFQILTHVAFSFPWFLHKSAYYLFHFNIKVPFLIYQEELKKKKKLKRLGWLKSYQGWRPSLAHGYCPGALAWVCFRYGCSICATLGKVFQTLIAAHPLTESNTNSRSLKNGLIKAKLKDTQERMLFPVRIQLFPRSLRSSPEKTQPASLAGGKCTVPD